MAETDYYKVLGVAAEATPEDLKKSYRTLAKRYHPDRNRGDAAAEARFKEIQEAYDVVGDPEKRRKYDDFRNARRRGFSGIDLKDLFGPGDPGLGGGSSIFDLFGGRPRARGGAERGADISAEITVPFETAAFGGKSAIRLRREEECAQCSGSGAAPGTKAKKCRDCRGTGQKNVAQGGFSFSRPCPSCYGRGVIVESPCPACGGSGRDDRGRRIEVKIPAGVADGAKIRLRAEGEMGENGGPPGDLLLTVRVAPHPSFQRDGIDIESEVEIDMVEAALGVTRDIQTLAGKVDLRIPPGVQPGARLRLKGRGVRDHRGRTGDHFVRVRVRIPRKLTERQIALLTEFRNPEGSEEKKEETGDDHEPRN